MKQISEEQIKEIKGYLLSRRYKQIISLLNNLDNVTASKEEMLKEFK